MRNCFLAAGLSFGALICIPFIHAGEVVDRIVATVNGRAILLSDLEEDLAYRCLLQQSSCKVLSEADMRNALSQLVDRELISSQIRLSRFDRSSPQAVEAKVRELRAQLLPGNSEDSEAWHRLLARHGLTEKSISSHVALEMDVARFTDIRFRSSVHIDPAEIESYYRETLLPRLQAAHEKPPELASVAAQIQEILIQQAINRELASWLDGLHEQGSVELR